MKPSNLEGNRGFICSSSFNQEVEKSGIRRTDTRLEQFMSNIMFLQMEQNNRDAETNLNIEVDYPTFVK